MRKNRLLAVVCAVVMNMSTLIGSIPVFAEETAEPNVQTDMKITGTSPLGEMLADKLTPEQTTLNEQNGCSIYDVKLSDKQAYVQFDTALDCTLLLTLFDDAEEKLLTSVDAEVTSEQTEIILDVPDMPEYCYLHCCLIDTETLAPVSAEYSSSLYTHEMQEFLLKTVDDFDEERVLNLDDDNTTNFAVLGDDVILLQSDESKNNVLSADEERKTYVLGNIDDVVRELKQGDVFALGNDAVGMIIATVDMISIDGATATITGADMELEDVFDYLRLESNPDAMEITQEPTAPDEDTPIEMISLEDADAFFDSVTPVNQIASQPGQQKPPQYFPEIRFVDVEGTAAGIAFKVPISTLSNDEKAANEAMEDVLKSFEPKEGQDGFDFKNIKKPKIFADFVCKLDFKFKFYISTAHQYLKLEPTATIGVQGGFEIKGTYSKRLTKAPIGITFFKIISLEVVPRFEVEGKIKGTIEGRIKYKPVISFDSDKDQKSNYSPEPDVAFTFKAVGTVFIGFSFAPALDVVSDDKIALKLELKVGLEAKAEWSKQLLPPEDNQHECVACIDGEINAVCSMSTKLIVLNLPALTYEWKLADVSYHIGNFYYSIDREAFGWGRCPYDFHKVTFVVLDNDDNPVNGAEVTAQINNQATSAHTGEDGKADLMMNAGKHSYTITKEGYKKYSDTVVVNNTSRLKYVTLSEENKKESGSSISGHRTPSTSFNLITPGDPSFTGTPDKYGIVTVNGLRYQLYSDHATVVGVANDNQSHPLVDAKVYTAVNGLPVTHIRNEAFYGCTSLIYVTIPDSVTTIGSRTFENCTALRSVTIPNSVTSIGGLAFQNTAWLDAKRAQNPLVIINGILIDGLTCMGDVTIPDSVTSISDSTFEGSCLTSLIIPESVTSIGDCAFAGCSSMVSVTIPESVTNIGEYAFYGCANLTSVTIPGSVTSISDFTFEGSGLTSIIIPESVTSIGEHAFQGCASLTNITIPDSVTFIGNYAFSACNGLQSVTISENVKSFATSAFNGCNDLTSVTIKVLGSETGMQYKDYLDGFYADQLHVTLSGNVTSILDKAFKDCRTMASVTIPESVTSIGECAFEGCSSMVSVTIPNSITSIGRWTFCYCFCLTDIVIPDSVTTIGDGAFEGCSCLKSITLPDSLKSICASAFEGSGLTSIIIPESITSLGVNVFSQCANLTSVTIPGSVTSIHSDLFYGCNKLTNVTLLNGLKRIEGGTFNGCTSLKSITIPASVQRIDLEAFCSCSGLTDISVDALNPYYSSIDGVLFNKKTNTLHTYPEGKTEENYVIPDSVTHIGEYAFSNCENLTTVTIPNSVTSIGENAFHGFTGLTSITIPDSVTSVGDRAFEGCTALTSVTIPDGLISIGEHAFRECAGLTSFTIPDSVTSIGAQAFTNCSGLTSVTIPASVTSIGAGAFNDTAWLKSKRTENPLVIINGILIDGSTCEGDVTIPDGVTSISAQAFINCSGLTSITIPDSVTNIGLRAFDKCTNLTDIMIPDSITSIERFTFEYCTSLTDIIIPDSVTSIGDRAFEGCTDLTYVTIPDGVTSIGYDTFRGTEWLNTKLAENPLLVINGILIACSTCESAVTIPDSVTSIGGRAFYQCTGLTSITIPDSVTSIGDRAFEGCTNLTSVTIPDSVTCIGDNAFYRCTGLTSVAIPDSVTSIGEGAFGGCTGLTSVTIPGNVTNLGDWTFCGCTSLASVTIPESVTSIGCDTFTDCENLKNVYYSGTEAQWNEISFFYLGSDTVIHFSTAAPAAPKPCAAAVSAGFTTPLMIAAAEAETKEETPSDTFRGETELTALTPNSVYNIYAVKSREYGVSTGNLLYFAQVVSDENGAVTVNYEGDVFAVKAIFNLANAEFSVPELAYDGSEKEIFPTVTANGKTLIEGMDYLVSGSYTGTEPGGYSILLEGTGDWFGEKALTYVIEKEMTTDVTTTTTNLTTTSTTPKLTTTIITTTETTVTTSETKSTEQTYLLGDVNADNEISVEDAQLALTAYVMVMAGMDSGLTDQQLKAADINGDGEVSVEDAQLILLYYVSNTLSHQTVTWDELLGKDKPPVTTTATTASTSKPTSTVTTATTSKK